MGMGIAMESDGEKRLYIQSSRNEQHCCSSCAVCFRDRPDGLSRDQDQEEESGWIAVHGLRLLDLAADPCCCEALAEGQRSWRLEHDVHLPEVWGDKVPG